MRFIASIDQGTTSTRCILFDRNGPVASSQKEHRQLFPQPGYVEHDPLEIWQRTQEVIRDVLLVAQIHPGDIAAVGITNQRETTVVWDKTTGRPYCNAIVWQDTRTKNLCDELAKNGGQDRFRNITGLPLATYFSAPKLKWILDSIPGVRAAADRGQALFGTIDTWLAWWLTGGPHAGVHVTDPTNASRTMLMDLRKLDWSDEMIRVFNIPRAMLPRIVPSSTRDAIGTTQHTGPFASEIPLTGLLGDQQAALVGQTCFNPGESKNTYGTGCFMLINTGEKLIHSTAGLLTTVAYHFPDHSPSPGTPGEGRGEGPDHSPRPTDHSSLNPDPSSSLSLRAEGRPLNPPTYALEGSIAVTGSLVQWLRDNLNLILKSEDVETLARSVPDNGGVYFVPAFSGLFAPYWRSDARGLIAGLSRHSNKAHLARAVLEATAYQTRDVLEAMRKDANLDLASLKVDGGMSSNELLMQFQADILNVPVTRPKVTETTALGAAYAAGLAVGFWSGFADLRSHWQQDKTWTPSMSEADRERLYARWKKAVERSFDWV